jgi:hypothetical protein
MSKYKVQISLYTLMTDYGKGKNISQMDWILVSFDDHRILSKKFKSMLRAHVVATAVLKNINTTSSTALSFCAMS